MTQPDNAAIRLPVTHRRIAPAGVANACYFRTTTTGTDRKALLQITERCNLHCAHCFVSSGRHGADLPTDVVTGRILQQLLESRVTRLTLTGGEPFAHPDVVTIAAAARAAGMGVTICTNATMVSGDAMDAFQALGGVKLNVSLDGFAAASHGKFRGAPSSFELTVRTARELGRRGLLKGILGTPNTLAEAKEFGELCDFATDIGAEYVLMNPLASMGRGVRGRRRLGSPDDHLRDIRRHTDPYDTDDLEVVRIRFPNDTAAPLSGCEAGNIIYVFATGEVTVCPYLVFAARTPQSQHRAEEFIVGNILDHDDIAARLDAYRLHDRDRSADATCGTCALSRRCGQGCPAAVIAAGNTLGDRDREQCPVPDQETKAA